MVLCGCSKRHQPHTSPGAYALGASGNNEIYLLALLSCAGLFLMFSPARDEGNALERWQSRYNKPWCATTAEVQLILIAQ